MKYHTLLLLSFTFLFVFLSCNDSGNNKLITEESLRHDLDKYYAQLNAFRLEFGGTYDLPDISFFLFGMGNRHKYLYKEGKLIDCLTGKTKYSWDFKSDMVVPSSYAVSGLTNDGHKIIIFEDTKGIWLSDQGGLVKINQLDCPINIPEFKDNRYGEILKVLHQEI